MSFGIFEHLAANDDSKRLASRKALAVARARANKRFARFLDASQNAQEREVRLALVAGDLTETVRQACADCEHEDWEPVLEAVQSHLGMIVEARRPKMCPFHREVTDISLQAGDPQAGFTAMGQHAFGEKSCRGAYEGNCNFKPEMTTQSYWDKKTEEADSRRQQREVQPEVASPVDDLTDITELRIEDLDDSGIDFANEPSAVGDFSEVPAGEPEMAMAAHVAAVVPSPLVHGGSLAPLSMIAQKKPGLMINGMPFEQFQQQAASSGMAPDAYEALEVSHPHPTWEGIASDILRVGHDGPLRDHMKRMKERRDQQQQAEMAPPPVQQPPMGGGPALASHTAEALETVDVTQGSDTALPKMDKRKWTPQNVKLVDTEMSGSPHPTEHQDIAQPASYTDESWNPRDESAVLKHQDIDKSIAPFNGQGGSFGKGNQAKPVTSRQADITSPQDDRRLRQQIRQDYDIHHDELNQPANVPCPVCGDPGDKSAGVCQACGAPFDASEGMNKATPTMDDTYDMAAGLDPVNRYAAQDAEKNPIREALEADEEGEDALSV